MIEELCIHNSNAYLSRFNIYGLLRTLCFHNPKTFELRPYRAAFSCFAGPKAMLFHTSMKRKAFWPWFNIYFSIGITRRRTFWRFLVSQQRNLGFPRSYRIWSTMESVKMTHLTYTTGHWYFLWLHYWEDLAILFLPTAAPGQVQVL
jgi:hypothetical protein